MIETPHSAAVNELCRRVADKSGDVRELIGDEVRRVAPLASAAERALLSAAAHAQLGGLGELETYLNDPTVDEVLVNAGSDIWIDRRGVLSRVGTVGERGLEPIIERILAPIGRRVDRTTPMVDARLPDGSRVCAVVPPVGVDGPSLSIRRFSQTARPLSDFTNTVGRAVLYEVIEGRCNVVVSGATSSGKTSLLAAVISTLPDAERIVVLEDTAELPVEAHHLVRLEARPVSIDGPPAVPLTDLVRTALRFRPDRVIVGEIRGDEVLAMVQAMNTGHDGSFSTCHANGPLDALLRLESLVLQAAPSWPLWAIREQLARSIDVIVHVGRSHTDGQRRIETIAEVTPFAQAESEPTDRLNILAATDGEDTLVGRAPLTRRR